MPSPGEFSQPDLYSQKRWQSVQHIAEEKMEKRVSSEATTETEIAKANTKFHRWRYNTVEVRMSAKPVANGKKCQHQN